MYSQIDIELPSDAERFQEFIKDLLEGAYGFLLRVYGRRGQSQHGIDIIGTIPPMEKWTDTFRRLGLDETSVNHEIAIQCKARSQSGLDYSSIKKDHDKARKSGHKIAAFIVVTSYRRDARLYDAIINNRRKLPLFKDILFYEDVRPLYLERPDLLTRYHPAFRPEVIEHTPQYQALLAQAQLQTAMQQELQNRLDMAGREISELREQLAYETAGRSIAVEVSSRLAIIEHLTETNYRDETLDRLLMLVEKAYEERNSHLLIQLAMTILLRGSNGNVWRILAVESYRLQRYDGVLWALNCAVSTGYQSAELWEIRCSALLSLGRAELVVQSTDMAFEAVGKTPELLWFRGFAYLNLGNGDKASDAFREAFSSSEKPSRAISIGYTSSLLWTGNYDEAERRIRGLIETDPDFEFWTLQLAVVLMMKGNNTESVETFEKVKNLLDSEWGGYYGYALRAIGRLDEGLPYIERVLTSLLSGTSTNQYKAAWYSELGTLNTEAGHYEKAEEYFQQAEDLYMDFPGLWWGRYQLHMAKREIDSADASLEKAIRIAPSNAEFHAHLAHVRLLRGRLEDANQFYTRATGLFPDGGNTFRKRASLDFYLHATRMRGEYLRSCSREALEEAEASAIYSSRFVQNVGALEILAVISYEKDNREETIKYCFRALELEPSLDSLLHIACCLAALGDLDAAVNVCARAAKIDANKSESVCVFIRDLIVAKPILPSRLLAGMIEHPDIFASFGFLIPEALHQVRGLSADALQEEIGRAQKLLPKAAARNYQVLTVTMQVLDRLRSTSQSS